MSDTPERILPAQQEIVYTGKTEDVTERFKKYPLPVGQASSISEMQADYHFFTPALLYFFGAITDLLWIDLQKTMTSELRLYHRKFYSPVVSGLMGPNGDTDWNHVLWAVTKSQWLDVVRWVTSVMLTDYDTRLIAFGEQDLQIMDPLAADNAHAVVPSITVSAFGIKTAEATFHFDTKLIVPALTKSAAHSQMPKMREALRGYKNPLFTLGKDGAS